MITPVNVIIDCDPGCDDTIALIAALSSPMINVLGITSIGGNTSPESTQKNALGLCAFLDQTHIPVYAGCDRPLIKKAVIQAEDVHGEGGIQGLTLPFNENSNAFKDMDAADFILKKTKEFEQTPISLIVIGPMTNIAIAFQRDPSLVNRVKDVTVMGGAFGNPPGNITKHAEFNVFCDPDAAKIVFDNFKKIKVFPLDITHQALQDELFRDDLTKIGPKGAQIAGMLQGYAETYPGLDVPGKVISPLHDFHTVASFIKPDLYQDQTGRVQVITSGENEGQTIFTPDPNGNTRVTTHIKIAEFFTTLKQTMKAALS